MWNVPFPGEPEDAFAAFLAWLADPRRTHPRAWARDRRMNLEEVTAWAARYAWDARARERRMALDLAAASFALALEEAKGKIALDRLRGASAAAEVSRAKFEAMAADARTAPGALELTARDAATLSDHAGSTIRELAPRVPEAPPTKLDLSALSDEELEELERIVTRAARPPEGG